MSLTCQSPTQHWSSENELIISCSTNSDNDSISHKHCPPQEFMNVLYAKRYHLNPTTGHHHQQHKDVLKPISSHELNHLLNTAIPLIIDVRAITHFSAHHIKSAINLTMPSILLKRASYTLDKVAQSLASNSDADHFRQWPSTSHIIFYDHASVSTTDSGNSATAILLALKFKNANYQGQLNYLKDGFSQFQRLYPDQCKQNQAANNNNKPTVETPFFVNIRQNIELPQGQIQERFTIRIPYGKRLDHGVIHLSASPTHHPRYGLGGSSVDTQGNFELPIWLKRIMDKDNGPKRLAEAYEQLERTEQKRLSFVLEYHSSHKSTEFPLSIASAIEKGTLNRYNNIWPYEYSRVKLLDKKDDYINASYIQYAVRKNDALLRSVTPLSRMDQDLIQSGIISQDALETMRNPDVLDKNRKYIATQGPLPTTFDDFWKMIWDESSYVIVMLTNEEELNKIKCHRYWPSTVGASQNYGSITVTMISEQAQPVMNMNDKRERSEEDLIIIRKFHLKHRSSLLQDRTVTHLQYTGWSDFGVPDHPIGLLQLIHTADEAYKIEHQEKGPMTVHCSAGCGRTGTFCVVDTIIQRLWHERDVYTNTMTDKVQEAVSRFREQRMSVVQTQRQYVFCYEAILWWLLGYGHLPTTPNSPRGSFYLDEDGALADGEDNNDDVNSVNGIVHTFKGL
ncbi:hypothetical protein BCV72DRAFT_313911 [Rhizopus microsporus var. microsporus]|uniref:protein-tyrosine-phosphatase n=1 Tax=Rhizopus microsporus var. microsporus TaxID=86635 RepID=A0A1X0QWB5_RHIZD|nr:hypothetical protein BCV72DRAFT_313911 [Rhizopus microsporus var. microsporus]